MGDWIEECLCKQWIHGTVSIMYLLNHLYVQNVYNSVMNFVLFLITYIFGLVLNIRNMQQLQVME